MLSYLNKETNYRFTENGALTYSSTGSDCLDLFDSVGAVRHAEDREIISCFIPAFTEDSDMATKILFYARDIREGLGERRVFRILFRWLAQYSPETVKKNIGFVSEYGRFDDLFCLMGTKCEASMLDFVKEQFYQDMDSKNQKISLLGKWLPSINASSHNTVKQAKIIASALGLSYEEYRKALSFLRAKIKIIENHLRVRDYRFSYEKQPSRALFKYRKAFIRNDKERYLKFIEGAASGQTVMHSDNVYPYELVETYLRNCEWDSKSCSLSKEEIMVLNTTWEAMPGFGTEENTLAVIDTSGSMYCNLKPAPASVALSLGLYFAEKSRGYFKNHLLTFSDRPQLISVKGKSFVEKLRYLLAFNEVANTNLRAVFDLILQTAVKHKLPQSELPSKLIIISDMEFDNCVSDASLTNFEYAKSAYHSKGYRLPEIVFWNVASRNRHHCVEKNERGVALISGVTPNIFSMVAGNELSPYKLMTDVINSKRYSKIFA